MNVKKVIKKLQDQYPGKRIVKNPEENPTEIICEIDPTSEHPEKSVAVAVIDQITPHYHKKTTEVYEVLRGELVLNIDGQEYVLGEGEKKTINPGKVHSAVGNETWIKAYSRPGWIPDDHFL